MSTVEVSIRRTGRMRYCRFLWPVVPFMHKAVPAYLYASTVFLIPMLVQTLTRLPHPGRRALFSALMATSLLGCLYNVYWWNRASNTYRREVEALRPVLQETIEECRASRGRVHAVEVLGLTPFEGPLLIFTPGFSPYSLNYAFFPFYRSTETTDEKYMQSLLIHWRGGPLTELEEERLKAFGGVRKTVPAN